MNGRYKSIGGDFIDGCSIQIGALWTGPKASKFKGVTSYKPKKKYSPSDIVKVGEYLPEQGGMPKGGVGASIDIGGIGVLLGGASGGKKQQVVTIEFSDGMKTAFSIKPKDKFYLCLKMFASENKLIDYNF